MICSDIFSIFSWDIVGMIRLGCLVLYVYCFRYIYIISFV